MDVHRRWCFRAVSRSATTGRGAERLHLTTSPLSGPRRLECAEKLEADRGAVADAVLDTDGPEVVLVRDDQGWDDPVVPLSRPRSGVSAIAR